MSWTTALVDIRTLLSDGPTDKLCWRKQIIGQLDGVNVYFKTFEFRRISAFVTATGTTVGVFVNNVLAAVTSEDLTSGQFVMTTPPSNGDNLTATYYVQWFTDAELTQFLVSAAEWIGVADNFINISEGLRPAAKEYACAQAYQKLVSRFSANLSETYQLFDAPDQKRFDPIKAWMDVAEKKMKLAFELRDDFYKDRQGMALAPIFGTNRGRVKDVPPHR